MVTPAAKGRTAPTQPDYIARAEDLAAGFAARAAEHDRNGSFPFQNFRELSERACCRSRFLRLMVGPAPAHDTPRA